MVTLMRSFSMKLGGNVSKRKTENEPFRVLGIDRVIPGTRQHVNPRPRKACAHRVQITLDSISLNSIYRRTQLPQGERLVTKPRIH